MTKFQNSIFSVSMFVARDDTKRNPADCNCSWIDPRGNCVLCGRRITAVGDKSRDDLHTVWIPRR